MDREFAGLFVHTPECRGKLPTAQPYPLAAWHNQYPMKVKELSAQSLGGVAVAWVRRGGCVWWWWGKRKKERTQQVLVELKRLAPLSEKRWKHVEQGRYPGYVV